MAHSLRDLRIVPENVQYLFSCELTAAVQEIIGQAVKDRAELNEIHEKSGGDIIVLNDEGVECGQSLRTGSGIMTEDGTVVSVRRILKVWQLRNRHSRDRGKRFWKGRLKLFH